jgi:cobalt/nickel transport system ATP-binding protein
LPKDEVRRRVERALAEVGLAQVAERPTHALSFGEKKRACLAGVLAMEPEVLILDEPDAGLDRAMTAELAPLLDRLHAAGRTVVVATHDVDFAFAWADEIIVLHEGAMAFQGPATGYDAICRALPVLGLELPVVLELFGELRRRGMIRGEAPPRTRAELLVRLGSDH